MATTPDMSKSDLRKMLENLLDNVDESGEVVLDASMLSQVNQKLKTTSTAGQRYGKQDRFAKNKLKAEHGEEYKYYMDYQRSLEEEEFEELKWEGIPDYKG